MPPEMSLLPVRTLKHLKIFTLAVGILGMGAAGELDT